MAASGFCDFGGLNAAHDRLARHALDHLSQADLLPCQIASARLADDSPEYRLLQSILLSAIEDVLVARMPGRTAAITHRRQLAGAVAQSSIAGGEAPMPFQSCCAAFGITVAAMRSRIAALDVRPRGHSYGRRYLPSYKRSPSASMIVVDGMGS